MAEKNMDIIDTVFEDFVIDENQESKGLRRGGVNIWLPEQYKDRFKDLQVRSNRRFGKKIQELVIKAIDKVSTT